MCGPTSSSTDLTAWQSEISRPPLKRDNNGPFSAITLALHLTNITVYVANTQNRPDVANVPHHYAKVDEGQAKPLTEVYKKVDRLQY